MRSLFDIVFKKPPVFGVCSYEKKGESTAGGVQNKAEQNLKASLEQDEAAQQTVVYWAGGLNEAGKATSGPDAKGSSSGFGSQKSLQQAERELREKHREKELRLEEELVQSIKEGYEEGRVRAEEESRELKKKAELSLREAELSLREARQKAKEIIASSEYKIIELAMAVAEKLVQTQLKTEPETITGIVRETMNILNGAEQAQLYVNPADHKTCLNFQGRLKEEFKELSRLEVVADEEISRGSCRIESESGVAEYLLEEEQEQLKEALLQMARRQEKAASSGEDTGYGEH